MSVYTPASRSRVDDRRCDHHCRREGVLERYTSRSAAGTPTGAALLGRHSHHAKDSPNTMRPAVLGAKGTTVFSGSRESKYGLAWGNYNSTCVDPSDPTVLWTYQEYATSSTPGQWSTCWVA